jgi:methylglutaconyl-CoA hydratase
MMYRFLKPFRPCVFLSTSTVNSGAEVMLEHLTGAHTGVSVITLNRPSRKNALGKNLLSELRSTVQKLATAPVAESRVVLLKSSVDGVFCAGADLKERLEMTPSEVSSFVMSLRSCFREIQELPQPTIAVVDGSALGGGLELALACDFRIGGSKAVVGLPETALAIIPGAGGTQRLSRLVGLSMAKKLVFTAERLNPQRALEVGIFDEIAQPGEESGYNQALALASKILPNVILMLCFVRAHSFNQGPIALRAAKMAINKGNEVDIASGFAFEELCYAQVIPTKDRIEGLLAFKEKRKPNYKGE